MWYVLEAEPGATLYYGFTHEISKAEFERRIRDNTLTEVLNAVPVEKGDCFFIPSGTLHAIRKGIVVAESRTPTSPTTSTITAARARTASPASCTSPRHWM